MTEEATGRAKGGFARAKSLSRKERQEIAKNAALTRWAGPVKKATHGSADHPLTIGDIEIPCYVLEDGSRVLSQRGVMTGLDLGRGSAGGTGGDRLTSFLKGKALFPFVSNDLMKVIESPIRFRTPEGGRLAFGYPATILPDLCDVLLTARKAGVLMKQQEHIADQCEILVRGFARVGIIALVDEATGYQRDRAAHALAEILEKFIAKELRPWVLTFPEEFYEQLFRLRGLEFPRDTVRRPQYFGHLTNDIIYSRLAPGVLKELKDATPRDAQGRHKHQLFRRLTPDLGHPRLREHLAAVLTAMKLSDSYDDFLEKLDRVRPRYALPPPQKPVQLDLPGL